MPSNSLEATPPGSPAPAASDSAPGSEQVPKLLRRQPSITGNGAHRDGVDRIMARNHKAPLAIAHVRRTSKACLTDRATSLSSLRYAKLAHLDFCIQFASWPAGALDAKASLFDTTEAWQAGLYAAAAGWCLPRMILDKRGTHQHLARHLDQIV